MQQQSSFDTLLTLDDNALLNLISEGNDDAVSALVLRYLSLVRKKASGIHLASMDADDLTQEGVMASLMDAIRTYRKDGGSSFATYASTCVDNRIRKAIAHANTGKNRAFASSLTLDEAPRHHVGRSSGESRSYCDAQKSVCRCSKRKWIFCCPNLKEKSCPAI